MKFARYAVLSWMLVLGISSAPEAALPVLLQVVACVCLLFVIYLIGRSAR